MKRRTGRNPVAMAMLRASIRRDVAALVTSADLQAWTGSSAANLVNTAGRLVYIVAGAAVAAGIDADELDCRILRGMAEALGDLRADGRLEFHRGSIQTGVAAIERLLPRCSDLALGTAALELDNLLATTAGVGTADLHAMFFKTKEPAP